MKGNRSPHRASRKLSEQEWAALFERAKADLETPVYKHCEDAGVSTTMFYRRFPGGVFSPVATPAPTGEGFSDDSEAREPLSA